jgi:pimeloyl-ACP methyl ester carboxylesterase
MLIMADPTIVLVHGAFADASSWRRLHAELAGDWLMIKAPTDSTTRSRAWAARGAPSPEPGMR